MKRMAMARAQNKFLELLRDIEIEEVKFAFLKWVNRNWHIDNLPDSDLANKEILESIATELRTRLPFEAVLPSEKITLPTSGPNADCDLEKTMHIDEFLYNDNYLDELVERGELVRHYCEDCKSRNVKLLNFISHSISIPRLQYIFKYLLPAINNEKVLDIGSRLGAVLYAAYLYTKSPSIVGVEMNPEFCQLQYTVLDKYMFGDRIQIICNNIFNEIETLRSADLIVLNNVFEFFADEQTTIDSWHLLAQNIKPGSVLVTIPHLDQTFKHVKINFFWDEWVEELKPSKREFINFTEEELQNHKDNVKHYRVKKRMNIVDAPMTHH